MKLTTTLLRYINDAGLVEFSVLNTLGTTSPNSLRVTLNGLAKKGEIYNPLKGIYVSKAADPFWVATRLYPGYVSLSSSFYLHNLIDEYPFSVFVGSEKRKVLQMGQHEFIYFKAKNYRGIEEGAYPVASTEKAICDSLEHGSFVNYARLEMVLHKSRIDSKKFIELSEGGSSSFFQRLGYLLSLLPSLDSQKRRLMNFCKKRVKANTYLQGGKRGTYISDWKLIDNIGQKVLLSWWE